MAELVGNADRSHWSAATASSARAAIRRDSRGERNRQGGCCQSGARPLAASRTSSGGESRRNSRQWIESELFGYKRGAFSGADRDKLGLIAAAHTGTLFLDEIVLCRSTHRRSCFVCCSRERSTRLSFTSAQRVDICVICATNRDLRKLVSEGRFRGDLSRGSTSLDCRFPPLRERKEDIYQLCRHLLARHGNAHLRIAFPLILALVHYDWPYNVRELEACLTSRGTGGNIGAGSQASAGCHPRGDDPLRNEERDERDGAVGAIASGATASSQAHDTDRRAASRLVGAPQGQCRSGGQRIRQRAHAGAPMDAALRDRSG